MRCTTNVPYSLSGRARFFLFLIAGVYCQVGDLISCHALGDQSWYECESDYGQLGYQEIEQVGIHVWRLLNEGSEGGVLQDSSLFTDEVVDALLLFYKELLFFCEQGYAYTWPVHDQLFLLLQQLQHSLQLWKEHHPQRVALLEENHQGKALMVAQIILQRCVALITKSRLDERPTPLLTRE